MRSDAVLKVRPHHLMCMVCWIGSCIRFDDVTDAIFLDTSAGRSEDTLDVLWERLVSDENAQIRMVEGNCEACHCCDGFDALSTRCVHQGGLLRDYKRISMYFRKSAQHPVKSRTPGRCY